MKTYSDTFKQYTKTIKDIETSEAKIRKLNYMDERGAAFENRDFETIKKYRDKAAENINEINKLHKKAELLKLEKKLLLSNLQYLLYVDGINAIKKAFEPYEGKPYGPKTAGKIKQEINEAGFGFWFEYSSKDGIQIYKLDKNGLHYSGTKETETRAYTDYKTPFIDGNNIIRVNSVTNIKTPAKYYDDTKKAARDIKKAFENYKKAIQDAQNAEALINELTPASIHFNNVQSVNRDIF